MLRQLSTANVGPHFRLEFGRGFVGSVMLLLILYFGFIKATAAGCWASRR
jgi:hypothetical protein